MVTEFLNKAKELNVKVDSIVVEENNNIQIKNLNNMDLHELRSCSKLLIAFAYGIALDEGFKCKYENECLSLNTKIYSTLSAVYKGNIPEQVKEWTIKTLLTHSTGYEKMMLNEKHLETLGNKKPLEVLFNTDIKYIPNTHFTYSNVEPYLLSIFFQENFNINISDFINNKIFKHLAIKNYVWNNLDGYCAGATGLKLNYIDFHKIGQLLLNKGKYKDKQIIPKNWIKMMTSKQVECPDYYKPERVLPKLNAGFYTWMSKNGIIFRDGSNGQYIICDTANNRLITIMSTQKDMSLVTECLRNLI